jgi:hypothetical protein
LRGETGQSSGETRTRVEGPSQSMPVASLCTFMLVPRADNQVHVTVAA